MRILYVIEGLGTGGAERSLAEMLPRFLAAGVQARVVCLYARSGAQERVEQAGVEVTLLDSEGWFRRTRELGAIIGRWRPDVVHTMLFRTDLLGRLASVGRRARVLTSLVATPYAPIRLDDPRVDPRKLGRARWVDSWTGRLINTHFHAVSESVAAAALRDLHLDPQRITVVPRGRDAERLGRSSPSRRARSREALGLGSGEQVVVTVGRHEFQKDQVRLIEALTELARHRPPPVLLIAGREGQMTSALRSRSLELSDRVRLLGHREDLPDILAAADVFAFPSLYEGMPGAVLEAMALNLPVVASDIQPIREVVDPGVSAILVPPRDSQALAAAIDQLLADPDASSQLGKRGREIFERRFTLERSVEGMLDLYRSLLRAST